MTYVWTVILAALISLALVPADGPGIIGDYLEPIEAGMIVDDPSPFLAPFPATGPPWLYGAWRDVSPNT